MKRNEAISEAKKILDDEANCLALFMHEKAWEAIPHRAKVAIRLEVERLRAIADAIKPGSKS